MKLTFLPSSLIPTLIALLCLLATGPSATAQLTIPGADGADGSLIVTSNRVIDLSLATSGTWNDAVTSTNMSKGIYDAGLWR